jgi:hypothetical protein
MSVLLWVVVLAMLSAAAAMGAIAWRMRRDASEREAARVELLRTLALADGAAVPAADGLISGWMAEFPSEKATASAAAIDTDDEATSIFAERDEPVTPLPRWLSFSAVGGAMALIVTLYVSLAGGARPARAADAPLELIALDQQFGASGFSVSGVVRVPQGSPSAHELTAVVNLFDANDRLLTSQTTTVERADLDAGQASAFSLTFARVPGTVARYRVGFRAPGGGTVAHVDRRAAGAGVKAPTS